MKSEGKVTIIKVAVQVDQRRVREVAEAILEAALKAGGVEILEFKTL